jgi:hypothetical protein
MEKEEFKLNGHDPTGNAELSDEIEEMQAINKRFSQIRRDDGAIISATKQDVTLMKQMIHPPDKADEFIRILGICDFISEDEANCELDAFYEAIRLGMSTEYNIAHALSRASVNRKGAHHNSRVASLLDALSHQKITSNMPRGKESGSTNPRSPLS